MFLRPQHFQQNDRFHDWNVALRFMQAAPYPWGITELVIDESLAMQGKFSVRRCVGVMSDGTAFAMPDELPLPDPIDVPADARDAVIALTLPAQQIGSVEFRDAGPGSEAMRFVVDEEEVADAFAGGAVREPIDIGRPNLRFGITRDQTFGRICLGLARVREVQSKRVVFDEGYIPPVQDIRASRVLKSALDDLLGRIEQRLEELALRAVDSSDGHIDSFLPFLRLQALSRWAPVLRHLDALPTVHPERLYQELAALAGEYGALTRDDRRAPVAAPYDHENLRGVFDPLLDLLRGMLSYDTPTAVMPLPLDVLEPGSWISTIHDHNLYETGQFFLAAHTAGNMEQARQMIPHLTRIGAGHNMEQIIFNALPGIPLRHVPTPPRLIRPIPGYIYFELDRSVPEWFEFRRASALGVHIADPNGYLPELRLELWCVKKNER